MEDGDNPVPPWRRWGHWAPAVIPVLVVGWIAFLCVLVAAMPPVE